MCVIPDRDSPGWAHAEDVAESLLSLVPDVRIIDTYDVPEKGDVVDFIEKHGPEKAKEFLLRQAEKAWTWREEKEQRRAEEEAHRSEPKKAAPPPTIVLVSDLLEKIIPPTRWIVQDLLPEGLTLLVSRPKMGKSWLTLGLTLAAAKGMPALNYFETEPGETLTIALEDGEKRLQSRCFTLLQGASAPKNASVTTEWPELHNGGLEHLHKTLEERPETKLITIDTYARFRGRKAVNEDAYSGDYSDLSGLHKLATSKGIAIIVVHHSRKDSTGDAFDSALGSTALTGAVDTLLSLKRESRLSTEAVLYVAGRDVPDAEHAIRFEEGIWTYAGDPAELRLTEERREIRQALIVAKKPLNIEEIKAALGGKKSYSAIKKLVQRMVDKGDLERAVSRGRFQIPQEDEEFIQPTGLAWDCSKVVPIKQ